MYTFFFKHLMLHFHSFFLSGRMEMTEKTLKNVKTIQTCMKSFNTLNYFLCKVTLDTGIFVTSSGNVYVKYTNG